MEERLFTRGVDYCRFARRKQRPPSPRRLNLLRLREHRRKRGERRNESPPRRAARYRDATRHENLAKRRSAACRRRLRVALRSTPERDLRRGGPRSLISRCLLRMRMMFGRGFIRSRCRCAALWRQLRVFRCRLPVFAFAVKVFVDDMLRHDCVSSLTGASTSRRAPITICFSFSCFDVGAAVLARSSQHMRSYRRRRSLSR